MRVSKSGLVNRGSVNLSGSSTLTVSTGTYSQGAGQTNLVDAASQLVSSGGIQLSGGDLTGIGTVNGPLTNNGRRVAPAGNGVTGTLTVTGAFTQTPTGVLAIDITSTGADQLAVGTSATLDGELALATDPTYSPASGASRTLITYTTRTGFFTPVTGAAWEPPGSGGCPIPAPIWT